MTDDPAILAFVRASAQLLGLSLDEATIERVSAHLGRTAAMAAQLEAVNLAVEDEPVALFCPAPFPSAGEGA